MFIFLSVCSLLVPLSMIILGYTWKNKPPKDRQGISGYQTTMSRMNDETWKYARGCGRFLGPELSNSKTASILHWTQTS